MNLLLAVILIWLICSFMICAWYEHHEYKNEIRALVVAEHNKSDEAKSVETEDNSDQQSKNSSIKETIIRACMGYSYCVLLWIGRIPAQWLRKLIYRLVFRMQLEKKVLIYGRCEFRSPHRIKIGKGTIIGDSCRLDARNGIEFGENVNVSSGVWFWTEQHDVNDEWFRCLGKPGKSKKIVVDDRAWISCRSIILPGVHIGEGSVIAAGAVVTKDVEPFSVYAGCPAKKIGERNRNLKYEMDGKPLWFF